MNLLREFLVSLASRSKEITADENTTTVANIKKEIVDTLRKVVQVVSKYAGSGLPEQAKASVRGFILALPTRWAILNSTTNSPTASPSMGPVTAHETSVKLLNFGGESVEMINSVAHVFSDTIERAELWLSRLRVVGVAGNRRSLQPSAAEASSSSSPAATAAAPPPAPEQMDLNWTSSLHYWNTQLYHHINTLFYTYKYCIPLLSSFLYQIINIIYNKYSFHVTKLMSWYRHLAMQCMLPFFAGNYGWSDCCCCWLSHMYSCSSLSAILPQHASSFMLQHDAV